MSDHPAVVGALLGLAFGMGVLLVHRRLRARRPQFSARIAPYLGPRSASSRLLEETRNVTPFPMLEQFIAPWIAQLGRAAERLGGSPQKLAERLRRAGTGQSVEQFRAQQVVFGVLGLALGLLLSISLRVLRGSSPVALTVLVLICAVVGGLVADQLLTRRIREREQRMLLEFPTIAELFALAVGAGESPTSALERVCSSASGELVMELREVLNDVHAGTPFIRALEKLADSTSLAQLSRFAEGVAVAVERGTPLAEVLRDQAQDVRDSGRRALMELGGRKEVLMMIPVVFLLLPITVVFAVFPSAITLQLGF